MEITWRKTRCEHCRKKRLGFCPMRPYNTFFEDYIPPCFVDELIPFMYMSVHDTPQCELIEWGILN